MTSLTARRLMTLMIVATVAVGVSGCSGESSEPEASVTVSETAFANEPTTEATAVAAPTTEAAADQSEALGAYVEAAQAAVPTLMETFSDAYSDIKILGADGDTFEFAYTYKTAVDPVAAAAALEEMIPTYQSVAEGTVIPEMEGAGVTEAPKVRYTYYNADGSLVWTHTFERP